MTTTSGFIPYPGDDSDSVFPVDDTGIVCTGETSKVRLEGDFDGATITVQENMGGAGWVDYVDGTTGVDFTASGGSDVHLPGGHQIRFALTDLPTPPTPPAVPDFGVYYRVISAT